MSERHHHPGLDLSEPRALHLVGAGGVGMSVIADLLVAAGHRVTGSDIKDGPVLDRLRRLGVEVLVGNAAGHVGEVDAVAIPSVVADDNVEVVEARRRGIPVLRRGELLAALGRVRRMVAVSGTHGKTTTTAMLATVLAGAGADPSFVVGGDLLDRQVAPGGGGARWGTGDWLLVEADEADGTFEQLDTEVALVTSVDADHLDFYGTVDAVEEAFGRFLHAAPGLRVTCADDPRAARLGAGSSATTYGRAAGASYRMLDTRTERATATFTLARLDEPLGEVSVPLPGVHNATNAAGAMATALELGLPFEPARRALAGYRGVARRFQVRGEVRRITVVDDYAHNPGKVAAVLGAARTGGWRRVVTVFQPHRFSRTRALADGFGDALAGADLLVITDIYPAGEPPAPGVTGKLLVDAVLDRHPRQRVAWLPSLDDAVAYLSAELRSGDLCLTLGAGDVTGLADRLLPALEDRS